MFSATLGHSGAKRVTSHEACPPPTGDGHAGVAACSDQALAPTALRLRTRTWKVVSSCAAVRARAACVAGGPSLLSLPLMCASGCARGVGSRRRDVRSVWLGP